MVIFDFDRCTGRLLNGQTTWLPYEQVYYLVGAVASPNSRFLYYFNEFTAYQFDLWAPDIFSTRIEVARWDGTLFYGVLPVGFFAGAIAPDGKIYINSNKGNIAFHRIEFPNRQGLDCKIIQNRIKLPNIARTEMPNHPNYRLGPLDGSPCDTLGLDNRPLARWRYDIEDTLQPLRLTFTDLTDYEPASWHWDFGDGTTGTGQYPQHSYAAPGIYTVCLTACNPNSCDTLCKTIDLITVAPPRVADFTYRLRDSLRVAFTDLSSGNDWVRWNFGHPTVNGNESGIQHPVHTFPDTGIYTVCLVACTPFGCDTLCQQVAVYPLPPSIPVTAAFTHTATGLTASFTDQSQSDSLRSWHWDFGDGTGTSTLQHPAYQYDTSGTYTVCLIACSPTDCDTFCAAVTVVAPPPTGPTADFGYILLHPNDDPRIIYFVDQTRPRPVSWHWDFGDGSAPVTGRDTVTHTFPGPGTYRVCLTVCDAAGLCDTLCRDVIVYSVGTSLPSDGPYPALVISPNPTSGDFTISWPGAGPVGAWSYQLFDASGREVLRGRVPAGLALVRVPAAALSAGAYTVRAVDGWGRVAGGRAVIN